MKLNIFYLFILLFWPLYSVMAQDNVNMKFGKPTKEEMQMTTYAADPSADAVVLCRLTDVEYTVQTSSFLADYREKVRIKVLKPSGARFAKVVVPVKRHMSAGDNVRGLKTNGMSLPKPDGSSNSYFEGEGVSMTESVSDTDGDETVESVKATAFNMEGSKVVKTSLKKSDVVTTKIDEHNYQTEFTVPNVKEGTVIEYEYTIHSQVFWELHDWYAQCEIPVVYAKLDMNIPSYLIFNIEDHGIQRLTYTVTAGVLNFKLVSDPLAKQTQVKTNHYVYVGRDLIAMPKDDYVWNAQDYCAGITAELRQYRLPGMAQMDYARTWEQIDEMVLSSDDLGVHLNDRSPFAKELKEAKIAEIADLRERAAAVFELVMSKLTWNGKYEISPVPASETLQKQGGSNADINLLLIQSFNEVGLTAAPVMLRTRDLGLLPYNFPAIRKLSTFIVAVVMPAGANIYLDASSKNGYLNVLAEPLLVERARLIQKKNKSAWVNLQKLSKSQKNTIINAQLAADGTLTGTQTTRYEGLAAMNYRNAKGINAFAPDVTEEVPFTRKGQVDGNTIKICPFPTIIADNPFSAEIRKMPVEFHSLGTHRVVVNITLPEGYIVESEQRNTTVITQDKGLEGRIQTTTGNGKVQLSCQFSINKIVHSEKSYADLHLIFDDVIKYTTEQLVIKKM
jgi:hypothetical protein